MSEIMHKAQGAAKFMAGHMMSHTPESRARLAVCQQCDQLTESRQCAICSCKVDQKVKYPSENCPLTRVIAVDDQSVKLTCKWGTVFRERAPRGFARAGDVIIHPTHKSAINMRTKERAHVDPE